MEPFEKLEVTPFLVPPSEARRAALPPAKPERAEEWSEPSERLVIDMPGGFRLVQSGPAVALCTPAEIEAMIAAAVQEEREACAKIADDMQRRASRGETVFVAKMIGRAIRARGE